MAPGGRSPPNIGGIEDPMEGAGSNSRPRIRSAVVTVRRPGGGLSWQKNRQKSIRAMEMTKTLFDDPKYWRAHAAQIRAQAEQMGDPDAKRMMLEIAANYDALTKRAEQRNKQAQ
jgi:hypothetical protein